MGFLDELAARRRFGMRPGLGTIRQVLASLGDPERSLRPIHIAGTNGKGAVAALLDAALAPAGRYTSPHLVRLNERFMLAGVPLGDEVLERAAERVRSAAGADALTFFEALTAVAFLVYAEAESAELVLETGLGGRLDATNVCQSKLAVITRVGLDHCDWLGTTEAEIAREKAGIVKAGVPVVLALNSPAVVETVRKVAAAKGAPFHYAPDLVAAEEVPAELALAGEFNRENARTAMAALKVLYGASAAKRLAGGFACTVWPGRFQRVGNCLVDGAHNPPAATALAEALDRAWPELRERPLKLVFGCCADKDSAAVLTALSPFVREAYAVQTVNPRSLSAVQAAAKMRELGMSARAEESLAAALGHASVHGGAATAAAPEVLICGSLFLVGEALVRLDAYPWPLKARFDPSEALAGDRSFERHAPGL